MSNIVFITFLFVCITGFCLRTGWFWVRIMDGALGMATVGYEYFGTRLNTVFVFCFVLFFFLKRILPLYQLFYLPVLPFFLLFFLHGFAWGITRLELQYPYTPRRKLGNIIIIFIITMIISLPSRFFRCVFPPH